VALHVLKGTKAQESRRPLLAETVLTSGNREWAAGKRQLANALKGGPSRKEEVAGTWKQARASARQEDRKAERKRRRSGIG
jgi:hypothetical protein